MTDPGDRSEQANVSAIADLRSTSGPAPVVFRLLHYVCRNGERVVQTPGDHFDKRGGGTLEVEMVSGAD